MEEWLRYIASYSALMLELIVVAVVLIGAIEALLRMAQRLVQGKNGSWTRHTIWLGFAGWILIALEFALGADIIRTAIAPSWDDVGKLAAIAAIRTGLSYFLERDISEMSAEEKAAEEGAT